MICSLQTEGIKQHVPQKQKGATLLSVMTFLILMTVVGVSASKMAVQDVLVAGNDQQKMSVYISSDGILERQSTFYTVISNLPDIDTPSGLGESSLNGVKADTMIRKTGGNYDCTGIGGRAQSLSGSTRCYTFDITVSAHKEGTGARDEHVKGVGKEFPKATEGNYLN